MAHEYQPTRAAGTGSQLLSGLTPAQTAAVTSDAAPLCIVAAAGSGKTRVLTRRIAYRCQIGSADARHTLALTFTRKAAGELHDRLARLGLRGGVAAGTFHGHAAAQLQRWWADRRQSRPTLLERKSRLLGPLAEGRPGLGGIVVSEVAGHIEWAKARAIGPQDMAAALGEAGRPLGRGVAAEAIAALYARYEDEKRRRGLIDFEDLLAGCSAAMERDPEFAGAQRWRWRHIYVDEFQDLNPLQHRLLLAWLGTSTDLCVVGDPNQAIYGWNGADPGLLAEFPRRWPGAEILHLDANHRCTEEIVRTAAAVLGPKGDRLSAAGRRGPAPEVRGYSSDGAEADGVATGMIKAHEEGRPWSAMAVLTRTNAQLDILQLSLDAAGVPCWSAEPAGPAALGVEADSSPTPRPMPMPPAAAGGRAAGPGRTGSVTLSTFHRAKGLEWDEVWVAGLEEGLVPIAGSRSGGAEAEEGQLLYVALTRAGEQLHLSWARTRRFGNRPVPRQPSRWLPQIEGALSAGRGHGPIAVDGGPDAWRSRFADQRDRLRRAGAAGSRRVRPEAWPEPDRHVKAALIAWRLEAARHSGVPPHVLLHDVTIDALAVMQPRTMDDLLAVPGLGPVKAGRFGSRLIALMQEGAASA